MEKNDIEARLQDENIVELGSKTRSHFLRLTPNGATIHERNTVATIICQTSMYIKRKVGNCATVSELREHEPALYGSFVENVQKAVDKYGFVF